MDSRRWTLAFAMLCVCPLVVAEEVVYDGLADRARWGWGFTDPGETWSFEEHDGGIEREAMVADYIGLAGTARYGTLFEFGTKNFNSDGEVGRADLILRLHEIEDGLPGEVFWSTTIPGVEFERTGNDRVETVPLNVWLPEAFFFSFEAVNVTEPGFGVLFAGTDRLPWVGTGDEVVYQIDSDTLEWELEDSGPTSISIRIHAAATCPADFNGDSVVNSHDFLAFLNAWAAADPRADWNEDGTVNTQDFIAFLNEWVAGC
ncbi:MAG: GC-type dockerin domain-anchored protein [Phycisphaerales bacterium JB041]